MAKIVLTISANNKATQSVKLLNAEVQTLSKTLSSMKVDKNLTTQINALTKYYTAIAKAHANVIANVNKEAISNEKLALAQAKVATQIAKTNTENARTAKVQSQTEKATRLTTSQVQRLAKQYADLLNQIKSLERSYKKGTFDNITSQVKSYFSDIQGLDDRLKSGEITIDDYNNKIIQSTAALQGFKTDVATTRTEAKNFHGTLQDTVTGFLQFQLSAMLVMKPLQLIRSAFSSINETLVNTENRIVELNRVVNGAANANELYDLAIKYGQTFENVSEAALNFARRGMSWNESLKATEAALLAVNVAELNVSQATDGLGAIMAQFNLQASELTNVVDMLNKTADNFPVTTEKILAALQRTGSTAATANLSLEETIGLITTLSKATNRSGENIGTALNSILNISQKDSTLNTFSKLGDNVAKIVEQYRGGGTSILEVLRAVGEQVEKLGSNQILDSDDFASLNDELKESMGEDFEMLSEIYGTAGTYRRNYFIALLNDLDTVKQVTDNITDANGYSAKENQQYLDTYEAKLNSLQAQWQKLANDEQGWLAFKKGLVDIGSWLLKIVEMTGGLRTTVFALGTALWFAFGDKILNGVKSLFGGIKNLVLGLKNLKTVGMSAQTALGWIGAFATILSLVIGAIDRHNQEQEEMRRQSIAMAAESVEPLKKSISELTDIYDDYTDKVKKARDVLADENSTTAQISSAKNTLLDIQNSLVKSNKEYSSSVDLVNGDLEEQLGLLTKLEENEARKKVEEYLSSNADGIYEAEKYWNTTSDSLQFQTKGSQWNTNRAPTVFGEWLKKQGYEFDYYTDTNKSWWEQAGDALTNIVGVKSLNATISTDALTPSQQIELLESLFNKAGEEESESVRDEIQAEIRKTINYIKESENYKNAEAIINGTANSWNAPIDILKKFRDDKNYKYEQFLKDIGVLQDEIDTSSANWTNNIKDVSKKYSNLIDKIEELRDLQKESTEWEEKKLAVLEAEQALENARNEATVRRFNTDTNQWEWQTDEKKIADAEENLQKAQLDLQESAYNTIIEQLKSETATNESILAILKEVAPLLGEDFANAVKNAIQSTTKVDLDKPIITKDGTYDNGGIANGLGFMPKATSKPESVNDPELTRKILTPVSNAEFTRYTKAMGIMFEQAHNFAQMPQIERVNNTTDNSVNNSGQVNIRDVHFEAEAQNDSIANLFAQFKIIPNN